MYCSYGLCLVVVVFVCDRARTACSGSIRQSFPILIAGIVPSRKRRRIVSSLHWSLWARSWVLVCLFIVVIVQLWLFSRTLYRGHPEMVVYGFCLLGKSCQVFRREKLCSILFLCSAYSLYMVVICGSGLTASSFGSFVDNTMFFASVLQRFVLANRFMLNVILHSISPSQSFRYCSITIRTH